jgi:nitrogen-specific signal transduction histidine kinase
MIGEDVQIVVEAETNLGSIRADRGQIEQILMNLATNSISKDGSAAGALGPSPFRWIMLISFLCCGCRFLS